MDFLLYALLKSMTDEDIKKAIAQAGEAPYRYKGTCEAAELPTQDNEQWDVWRINDSSEYGAAGTYVVWDGESWNVRLSDPDLGLSVIDGAIHITYNS